MLRGSQKRPPLHTPGQRHGCHAWCNGAGLGLSCPAWSTEKQTRRPGNDGRLINRVEAAIAAYEAGLTGRDG